MKREELIKKYKNKIAELQRTRDRYYSMGISDAACIIITGEIQAYNAVINDFSTLPDEKEEPLNIYCNCYKQKKEDKEKGFCTQCEKLIISHEKLQSDKRKAR